MASELKVDKFTGVTTAGSILVTGEGNSTTTNLQQGLAKHWIRIDGSGTIAARDSFNTSGVTDNATGIYTPAFTNNMSNANYSVQLTSGALSGSDLFFATIGDESGNYPPPTSSNYRSQNVGSSGIAGDTDHVCGTVNGDLA